MRFLVFPKLLVELTFFNISFLLCVLVWSDRFVYSVFLPMLTTYPNCFILLSTHGVIYTSILNYLVLLYYTYYLPLYYYDHLVALVLLVFPYVYYQ